MSPAPAAWTAPVPPMARIAARAPAPMSIPKPTSAPAPAPKPTPALAAWTAPVPTMVALPPLPLPAPLPTPSAPRRSLDRLRAAGFTVLRELFGASLDDDSAVPFVPPWLATRSLADDGAWMSTRRKREDPASLGEIPFYVDAFFPSPASYGPSATHRGSAPWVRLWGSLSTRSSAAVAADARARWCLVDYTLAHRAVEPGVLMNRALTDALSAVACCARLFEALLPEPAPSHYQVLNEEGIYAVRLWCTNCWRVVLVDDYLPRTTDGALLLARPLSAADPAGPVEVWGSVCEKAIAKLLGCYERCEMLELDRALEMLTGGVPLHLIAGERSESSVWLRDQLWRRMREWVAEGSVVVCSRVTSILDSAAGPSAAPQCDVILECIERDTVAFVRFFPLRLPRSECTRELPFDTFWSQLSEVSLARTLQLERDGGEWQQESSEVQWIFRSRDELERGRRGGGAGAYFDVTAAASNDCEVVISVALLDRRFRCGCYSFADVPPMEVLETSSNGSHATPPRALTLSPPSPAIPRISVSLETVLRSGDARVFRPLPCVPFVGSVLIRVFTRGAANVRVRGAE